jgi:hypothetical protein
MGRRDLTFVLGTLGLTACLPTALSALSLFAEERSAFGTWSGWVLALTIMVPSYVLLARGLGQDNPHRFVRSFMLGMLLRMGLTLAGVAGFALLVDPAPLKSFLLAFFLGYALLTALELVLSLRTEPRRPLEGESAG